MFDKLKVVTAIGTMRRDRTGKVDVRRNCTESLGCRGLWVSTAFPVQALILVEGEYPGTKQKLPHRRLGPRKAPT